MSTARPSKSLQPCSAAGKAVPPIATVWGVTSTMAGRGPTRRCRRGWARSNTRCRARTPEPRGWEQHGALLPEIAGAAVVEPANPDLKRALDRAFAEPEQLPLRHTKAVVVVKDGHIIAERYAPGYGVDTPILGYSAD